MKTILAPVDFSSATPRVLAEAVALARPFSGRLVLLHVTLPPFVASDDVGAAETIVELTKFAEKAASKELSRLREMLRDQGITAETVRMTGSPALAIVDQAKALAADYIVIGSHGHTAFYDLFVGSTASAVLKKSPCSVVIVPPPPKSKGSPLAK